MAISKVVVVDGNNLIVQIDRGVAGRGITDVQPIEIDNALYLEFFFSDGTTETVGPVGTIQYIGQSPIVVNASTISLSTVPVNLGGTGQTTANAGFNALAPSQTSNTGKYLKTDGTNTSWDLLDISTGDITGTLPVTNGGTGATTASGARTNLAAAASATTISAGTGLSGGGDLTANRTLNIANTGVTAAAYGSASKTLTATVNAQGQLTVLADTNIAIANTQVSGLGTASTQNAGVALGVATLDAGGTVPLSQIPASIQGGVSYQGTWNATTNTPTLTSSVGSKGYYYVVSVAGSTNLNGITSWNIGDWAIFNGTAWEKIDNTDAVTSVNGYTGTVVLTNTDITGFGTMSTQNANSVSITGGSVTGITDLAIADGGTGQSTAAAAITALTGTQVAGRYLRSDGTNAALSAIQAADVPTLNQNTSGTAAGLSATLAIASGGTGQTTANTAFNALAPSQTGNSGKYLTTDGSNTSWATNPLGTVTSVGVSGGTTGLTTSGGPITTSGTITLAGTLATTNGGTGLTSFTANGVVYASSTSALATGSALTFDGTGFQLSTSTGGNFYLNSTTTGTSNQIVSLLNNGNGYGNLNYKAFDHIWSYGATEQMRLTTTGLGIGTSSPGAKLEVYGSTVGGVVAKINNANASGYSQIYLTNSGASGRSYVLASGGNSSASGFANNFYIYDTAAAATRLTLDSAGNLGLGVTPSAWASGWKVLQIGGVAAITSSEDFFPVLANAYYDGANYRRITAGTGMRYVQAYGTHSWDTSASSTANSVITFTQAMTLDASGNLGVGTTSPVDKLQVEGNIYLGTTGRTIYQAGSADLTLQVNTGNIKFFRANGVSESARIDSAGTFQITQTLQGNDVSTGAELLLTTSTAANDRLNINFSMNGVANRARAAIGAVALDGSGGYNLGLAFYTRNAANGTALATTDERMRLDSSGNLGIGTSSPGAKLEVNQAATAFPGFKITGSNSPGMQIVEATGVTAHFVNDSAGVYVGSSTSYPLILRTNNTERARIDSSGNLLVGTTTNGKITLFGSGFSEAGAAGIDIQHISGSVNGDYYQSFQYNASVIGSITQNGVSQVLYNISSDQRLKENIQDAAPASALIDSLQVRQYDWKADGSHQRYGFVAQELVTVAPEAVHQPADPEEMMAVDYSKLVPMLVKEIQSLRTRLAALEAK